MARILDGALVKPSKPSKPSAVWPESEFKIKYGVTIVNKTTE